MKGPILSLAVLLCSALAFGQVAPVAFPRVSVVSAHPAHTRFSITHLPRSSVAFSIGVDMSQARNLADAPWIFGRGTWTEALNAAACQVLNATSNEDSRPNPGDDPKVLNPRNCAQMITLGQFTPLGKRVSATDPSVTRAFDAINEVLKYYATMFGLVGIDGKGSPVNAIIHVGKNYDNAFWDPDLPGMIFGDGDPEANTGDYTAALDVVGHEMTHGVISKIVDQGKGLPGVDENGALNEGCSDIMGVLINRKAMRAKGIDPDQDQLDGKPWSWTFGHGVYQEVLTEDRKHANETAFRSLVSPRSMKTRNGRNQIKAFPDRYGRKIKSAHGDRDHDACTVNNDFCEVHANATIPGHAAYLFATRLVPVLKDLPSLRGRLNANPASLESAAQKAEDVVAQITFWNLKLKVSSEEQFPGWASKMVQTCGEFNPAMLIRSGSRFIQISGFEKDLICGVLVSAMQEVELMGRHGEQVRVIR